MGHPEKIVLLCIGVNFRTCVLDGFRIICKEENLDPGSSK